MNAILALAAVVAIVLAAYLVFALVVPEKFS